MPNENDQLRNTIAQLNQRVRNLEFFVLAIMIGLVIFVARNASSWFMINNSQAVFFGFAFSICLMLLVWRHHAIAFLQKLGVKPITAMILVTGVAVLGVGYMIPALITVLR